jgi:hypothetical protein
MRRRRIMPRVYRHLSTSLEDFLRPQKSSIPLNMADTMDARRSYWYSEIRQGYGGALKQWCDGSSLDAIPIGGATKSFTKWLKTSTNAFW